LGLRDDDLRVLERVLSERAQYGPVMNGTGGVRKIRFALPGKGKSGGVRVVYALFSSYETVLLIMVFAKNEQANLTAAQKKACAILVKQFQKELEKRR
jgi:hypothetical protein